MIIIDVCSGLFVSILHPNITEIVLFTIRRQQQLVVSPAKLSMDVELSQFLDFRHGIIPWIYWGLSSFY